MYFCDYVEIGCPDCPFRNENCYRESKEVLFEEVLEMKKIIDKAIEEINHLD